MSSHPRQRTDAWESDPDWDPVADIRYVMSKGIALQFRREYPEMHRDYVERCRRGEVRTGEPYLYGRVLNFPTKDHWRNPSDLLQYHHWDVVMVVLRNQKYCD
jgi:hypothetical protein